MWLEDDWLEDESLDPEHAGSPPLRLWRSRDERIVAGVCGGLARWMGLQPGFVRIAYVGLSIFSATFPGLLVYALLWFAIPEEPRALSRSRRRRASRRGWRPLYRSEL